MSAPRILRSSALMGGATAISFVTGIIRTKIVAVLLGPGGVGLVGIFAGYGANVSAISCWGVWTSGVRTISAASQEDKMRKSVAVGFFGRILVSLGIVLVALSFWPVTLATFGSSQYLPDMFVAGMTVPLVVATGVWNARLQAYGHLRTVAAAQVLSALSGLLVGVPLIWIFGARGIALSLLLAALLLAVFTWRSSRRLCPLDKAVKTEAKDIHELIKLGAVFMVVGLMGQLAAYGTRLILVHRLSLEAAGHYQAAAAIAGSLPGLVVSAMGAGLFPQLASAADESESRSLVDGQIQVGILLGLPALVMLVGAGGFCLHLLYASTFDAAKPVLSWMVWGVLMRLLSWPMSYWLMARGSSRAVIMAEGFSCLCSVLLPLITVELFGLAGAGLAFFLGHAVYAVILTTVSRIRSGRWIGEAALMSLSWAIILMATVQLFAPNNWIVVTTGGVLLAAITSWKILNSTVLGSPVR